MTKYDYYSSSTRRWKKTSRLEYDWSLCEEKINEEVEFLIGTRVEKLKIADR